VDQRRAETRNQGPRGLGDIQHIPRIKMERSLRITLIAPERRPSGSEPNHEWRPTRAKR
jgi:hypothetical protein